MKRKNLLALTLLSLFVMVSHVAANDVKFTVVAVDGKVTYRAYKSFKREDVKVEDKLDPRGKIALADGDKLELKTPMGDVITFQDKTYATLSKLTQKGDDKEVEISMPLGKIDCDVKKLGKESSFQVRTPSAVAGVRGTRFGVQISPSGTATISVSEGLVAVAPVTAGGGSAPAVSVSAGQSASVSAGGGSVSVETTSTGTGGGTSGGGTSGGGTSGGGTDGGGSDTTVDPPEVPDVKDIDGLDDAINEQLENLKQIEFDVKR